MTTMAGRAFADTNIVLRLLNTELPKHERVKLLVDEVREVDTELWISRQIIREYLVQVTRPGFLAVSLTTEQVRTHVATLRTLFRIADETEAVTDQLLALLAEFPTGGKQIHDANIVATMLVNEIATLLTINVEDMRRFTTRVQVLSPR